MPHTDIWSNVWESCVKYEFLWTLWLWYISRLPTLAGLCLIRHWQFLETSCEFSDFFFFFFYLRYYIYGFITHWNKEKLPEEITFVFKPQIYDTFWMMPKMTHIYLFWSKLHFGKINNCSYTGVYVLFMTEL